MTVTLAIADLEDGTGGNAVISNGAGASNAVYYSPWLGSEGSLSGTLVGTVTGNGTLPLALPVGHYLWWCLSTLSGTTTLSDLVYQALTDQAEEAVHYAILNAVKTRILSLALTGIADAHVYRKWAPRNLEGIDNKPAVVIAPMGAETDESALLSQDDIGYPVVVGLVDVLNADSAINMNRDLLWREKILKAFRNQRLPGVPSVFICRASMEAVIQPEAFMNGYFVSLMLLRFTSRQGRGLT